MNSKEKIIGVLRGGSATHFVQSLRTGQYILDNIDIPGVRAEDIFVDKENTWHLRGFPVSPSRALDQVHALYNALHGGSGVDGTLQRLCDAYRTPYTGPGTVGIAVGGAIHLARRYIHNPDIKHVPYRALQKESCTEEKLLAIFHSMLGPCVVRPAWSRYHGIDEGDGVLVETYEDMAYAVMRAYAHANIALIEQYMEGEPYSVTVLDEYRGDETYAFPPIRTHTKEGEMTHLHDKHLNASIRKRLLRFAQIIHKSLHMRDYSQVHFLLRPEGLYFSHIHPTPALGENTPVAVSLTTTGISPTEFVSHVCKRALSR